MLFLSPKVLALTVWLGLTTTLAAQTAPKPAPKPLPWKSYCHPQEGFCFKYPVGWTVLGEVLGGDGVAVAPPQQQPRESWDAVTVALVIPAPKEGEDPVTLDQAIAKAVSSVRESGQNFETLQRAQRTVDGKPAQLVKVHYTENTTGREWIEALVFVEGPDSEIYSIALKCAPSSLARMEPLFLRMADSFTLPQAQPAATPPSDGVPPKAITPSAP